MRTLFDFSKVSKQVVVVVLSCFIDFEDATLLPRNKNNSLKKSSRTAS